MNIFLSRGNDVEGILVHGFLDFPENYKEHIPL